MFTDNIAIQLYDCYNNCTVSELFEVGISLYKQGSIDELRPEFWTSSGSEFAKGNPWVPYNNPTHTVLNEVRVMTYGDYSIDTVKQIN